MAKVSGPLFSLSASGKIGDAIVYFGWKGINTVRQWLVPANPESEGQGDARVMLGGTGKAVGMMEVSSEYHQQLIDLDLIPAGQTKQSYIVKYILDHYLTNNTTYASELAALTGATAYTSWQSAADDLGLTAFGLAYATVATYDKALGLYEMAKSAIALGFTGSPYNQTITTWTVADIDMFRDHLTV